jgi:hypothetical protein
MTSAAVLHTKNPPSPAGFLSYTKGAGELLGDVLCPCSAGQSMPPSSSASRWNRRIWNPGSLEQMSFLKSAFLIFVWNARPDYRTD